MKIKRTAVMLAVCLMVLGVRACAGRAEDDGERAERSDRQTQEQKREKEKSKKKNSDTERIVYRVTGEETPDKEELQDIVYHLQRYASLFSTEIVVFFEGQDQIVIEIPKGFAGMEELSDLEHVGSLYFIAQTDPQGNANYTWTYGADADGNTEAVYELTRTLEELEADGSRVLDGTDVQDAQATSIRDSSTGSVYYAVDITLTEAGAEKFADATRVAYQKEECIAIYYDGNFLSAPHVNAVITDGKAMISPVVSAEEAERMAVLLRLGSLRVGLERISP